MVYITDIDFKKLNLIQRYEVVSEAGHYIAKRRYRGMEVYLYKVDDFYVEVWKRFMMGEVHWIETVPEEYLAKYADSVDLEKLLHH